MHVLIDAKLLGILAVSAALPGSASFAYVAGMGSLHGSEFV
jgi:hypothetical protein